MSELNSKFYCTVEGPDELYDFCALDVEGESCVHGSKEDCGHWQKLEFYTGLKAINAPLVSSCSECPNIDLSCWCSELQQQVLLIPDAIHIDCPLEDY